MTDNGMDENAQSRLDFKHKLVFITLTGDTIEATAKRLSLTVTDETTVCTLTLEVPWNVYQQMISGEWMNLLAIARNSDAEMAFEEDQPIELRAVLRQSLLTAALSKGTEVEQVLQAMLQDSEDGKTLRLSESWLVTEVKQQVILPEELEGGYLKRGYRTLWAKPMASQSVSDESRSTLNEIVEAHLNRMEMKYEWIDETILRLSFTGEQGTWIVLVRTDEEKQLCIVYSIYPKLVPEEQRTEMALFLIEENYDLAVGSFELDTADGELRYRTSIDVENDRLTTELFGQLFTTNVVIMDQYFDAIGDGMKSGFPE